MEFLHKTKIDFMRYRALWAAFSGLLVVVSLLAVFVHGKLNVGIDFVGGTQLILKMADVPDLDMLREELASGGFEDAQIQRFGESEDNEVLIRTRLPEGAEEGSGSKIVEGLDRRLNPDLQGKFDLNRRGADALTGLLLDLDPEEIARQDQEIARERYEEAASALVGLRRDQGLIQGWEAVRGVEGLTPEITAALEERAALGSFSLLGEENVGPQVGSELRQKGIMAVLFSIVGMLIYIWTRFELRFGLGAVVALLHDVAITLGLFAVFDFEFNLSTIAAFLTLVGYSVNDSVVVFDRVRENLRKSPRNPLVDTLNLSLNQTLSRTVLTSGTTLLVIGSLLFLGGDVLRGFATVLFVGVVVGTYSSIFVASPFTLLWDRLVQRKEA